MLILDYFSLKYEGMKRGGGGGGKLTPYPRKKLPSKSPALLGMRHIRQSFAVAVIRGLKTDDKVAQ